MKISGASVIAFLAAFATASLLRSFVLSNELLVIFIAFVVGVIITAAIVNLTSPRTPVHPHSFDPYLNARDWQNQRCERCYRHEEEERTKDAYAAQLINETEKFLQDPPK